MGEKRPPGSSDSGVPAAGAVGRDVDVVGRKAARTVEWLVTLSTKVQWLSKWVYMLRILGARPFALWEGFSEYGEGQKEPKVLELEVSVWTLHTKTDVEILRDECRTINRFYYWAIWNNIRIKGQKDIREFSKFRNLSGY